ncbi:MAG: CPCC family cysteine-rich protein [Pseudomonadota bacterium]
MKKWPRLEYCPCCGLPSLTSRGFDEICSVCWWQDDGQDDPHADEVWGGPNEDYSLTQARENFVQHGHMYRAGAGSAWVENPDEERRELLEYVRATALGSVQFDLMVFAALLLREKSAKESDDLIAEFEDE